MPSYLANKVFFLGMIGNPISMKQMHVLMKEKNKYNRPFNAYNLG